MRLAINDTREAGFLERKGTCEHSFHDFDLSTEFEKAGKVSEKEALDRQSIEQCRIVEEANGPKEVLKHSYLCLGFRVVVNLWLAFLRVLARAIEVCSTSEAGWAVNMGLSGSAALCRNTNL